VHVPVIEALPPPDASARFDWIVLAVQPPQVEEAARGVVQHHAPSGRMVCFQNGRCEERVERVAGRGRVVGAVVAWGGSMPEPAHYVRTARGGFTLGLPSGGEDASLAALARWLEPVGPARVTVNLPGARWSKLAINCAISTLGTLGGGTLGAVMMHRTARRLGLELMSEVVAVARALGVSLEKIGGLDLEWLALTDDERPVNGSPSLVAKHSLLLAVGARYRRMRSSMLAAIERGRVPAVDFLNGEVADRGEALGVPTPVNREAQRMVHELARGRVQAGIGALRTLRERVDALATEPARA
jgi:2-dehydropantoate 2-reductase